MSVRDLRLSAFVVTLGLALGLALAAGNASAQEAAPAAGGRAWTDPPDRSATPAPEARRDESKPQDGPRAEGSSPVKASGPSAGGGRHAKAATAVRKSASRPSAAPRQAARRSASVARQATRSAGTRAVATARARNWTVRTYRPAYAEAPGIRYGYTAEEIPAYGAPDARTLRMRQVRAAREAGYLVVRAGDLQALRNRPFEIRREPEDQDDPED